MEDHEVIAGWEADEAAVRARLGAAGVAPAAEAARRSGHQFFEAIFAGDLPAPPIGDSLGYLPIHIEPGFAVFQGRPLPQYYNPLGTIHGGWFATLLDSAVGCAVHASLPAGKRFTTLELKMNMIRALTDSVPLVRAEGRVIHVGRQVATAEGRLLGPDGKLYAHATTTCLVMDAPVSPESGNNHG